MNRTKSIALFAGIFAIAMTTLGLSEVSSTQMMTSSLPQSQEGVGMLGHVEYKVLDSNDVVKGYYQADNIVVYVGTDCTSELLFGAIDGTGTSACLQPANQFNYIAIGNGTDASLDGDEIELESGAGQGSGRCAVTAVAGQDGEQARKLVAPTISVNAAGAGTQVVLEPTTTFKFDAGNATTVLQSGIFNGNNGISATAGQEGMCATYNAANWDMFSYQNLGAGVVVSAGDSLAVKWTITIQ